MIEFSNQVNECLVKVLLDSGATGNFISDAMVIVLNSKITSDLDFQDLTMAHGSQLWTTGYAQFTMNCGGYKEKVVAKVFPNLSKECILGMP